MMDLAHRVVIRTIEEAVNKEVSKISSIPEREATRVYLIAKMKKEAFSRLHDETPHFAVAVRANAY